MTKPLKIIILGGGLVGLSAAIAMRLRGHTVTLLEKKKFTQHTSRVYALNKNSQKLLEQLHVWPILDQTRLAAYEHMHIWDAGQNAHINFDARMIASDRLGTMIEEHVLKQGLIEQAMRLGVALFDEQTIIREQISSENVQIETENHNIHADLLIIASGSNSSTRNNLGVSMTSWPYHQSAIVANIQISQQHKKTAHQVFYPSGPLAFLPLSQQNQGAIVWSNNRGRNAELMACSTESFEKSMQQAFEGILGECNLMNSRQTFPLNMQHATNYTGDRWLLMGDAAHTIHPLAGLGLNLGLADLSAWINLIDTNQGLLWSKKTLGAYQRQRKHALWQAIAVMGGLKTLFSNPLLAGIRGIGLRACENLPSLKHFFIEHAG